MHIHESPLQICQSCRRQAFEFLSVKFWPRVAICSKRSTNEWLSPKSLQGVGHDFQGVKARKFRQSGKSKLCPSGTTTTKLVCEDINFLPEKLGLLPPPPKQHEAKPPPTWVAAVWPLPVDPASSAPFGRWSSSWPRGCTSRKPSQTGILAVREPM